MDFAALPPEVNSSLMYAGPGAGPMLAAAAGWNTLAAALESFASGYSVVLAGLAGQVWSGPTSVLMVAAVTPYVEWLVTTGTLAQQTAAQAYAAAAAYEAAFAATVPPAVIAANRAQLAVLVATNFFGQNTAAIMATEAQYMEMWAQDAAAMFAYAAASQTASTMTPFSAPPQITNPAGQANQARAVTQASANTTQQTSTSTQQSAWPNATQQASTSAGVDPPLPQGSVANVAPGGADVDAGVTLTATNGYPINDFIGPIQIQAVTQTTYSVGGSSDIIPAGATYITPGQGSFVSGTFNFIGPIEPGYVGLNIPSGPITGGTGGAMVTESASGLVTVVNSGAIITGPAVTPTPSGAGGLAAATGVSSSPGLAGTSGIQPQLNAPLLAEWARGLAGPELNADLAAVPGPELAGVPG